MRCAGPKAGLSTPPCAWTPGPHRRTCATTALLADLAALRFLDERQSAIILGPVGVGKTPRNSVGPGAIRRRHTVLFRPRRQTVHRLRAARLDKHRRRRNPRLTTIDVLIIDDFALRPLDATETSDFYEIVVERHRTKTTIVTSTATPPNGSP